MKPSALLTVAAGAVGAIVAGRAIRPKIGVRDGLFAPAVTVNRPLSEVRSDPEVATLLADGLVEVGTAPEDRGTVLAARRGAGNGRSVSWTTLRRLQQRLETGEVLRVDGQPHGRRAPLGAMFERTSRRVLREPAR
ncbi:MAG TPA: hypothetical protein VI076_04250 [Actinopolymorphaceae bacterium]